MICSFSTKDRAWLLRKYIRKGGREERRKQPNGLVTQGLLHWENVTDSRDTLMLRLGGAAQALRGSAVGLRDTL